MAPEAAPVKEQDLVSDAGTTLLRVNGSALSLSLSRARLSLLSCAVGLWMGTNRCEKDGEDEVEGDI